MILRNVQISYTNWEIAISGQEVTLLVWQD